MENGKRGNEEELQKRVDVGFSTHAPSSRKCEGHSYLLCFNFANTLETPFLSEIIG